MSRSQLINISTNRPRRQFCPTPGGSQSATTINWNTELWLAAAENGTRLKSRSISRYINTFSLQSTFLGSNWPAIASKYCFSADAYWAIEHSLARSNVHSSKFSGPLSFFRGFLSIVTSLSFFKLVKRTYCLKTLVFVILLHFLNPSIHTTRHDRFPTFSPSSFDRENWGNETKPERSHVTPI